jgi:cation/acetate symporter
MTLSSLDPHPSQYKGLPLALSLFTLALFLLTGLLAVMEKAGVVVVLIEALMALLPLLVFAMVGVLARTMKLSEYHWGGKSVPAGLTGVTLAACFVGGSFFPLFLSVIFLPEYISFPIVLGWVSSLVLCAVLFASPLRKFGSATVPEFLGVRLQSNLVRLIASGLVILVGIPLLCTEMLIGGQVLATSLSATSTTGILLFSMVLLISVVLGGVSSAVWTQALQGVLMVFACLSPVILLGLDQLTSPMISENAGFTSVVSTSLTEQLTAIIDLENTSIGWFLMQGPYAGGLWPLIGTALFFAIGMASLPHLLSKFLGTGSSSSSRRAAGYSLSFLLLLMVVGSAYFLLLADERLQSLLGPNALDQGHQSGLIAALIRSGIVAAALAASSALLMALSTSVSRDLIEALVLPRASLNQKIVLARVVVLLICAFVTYLAYSESLLFLDMLTLSLSLAAAAFFPVLVLSCWWSRFHATAAYSTMLAGSLATLFYALAVTSGSTGFWFGFPAEMGGLLGVFLGFAVGISLSYVTFSEDERHFHLASLLEQPGERDLSIDPPDNSDKDEPEELIEIKT